MTETFLWDVGVFAGLALGTLLGMPVTPLYVAAGARWGVGGLPLVMLALLVHMYFSYALARGVGRPLLQKMTQSLGQKWKLSELKELGPVKLVVFTRMIPGLPLCVQSYFLSLCEVPFDTYLASSLAVQCLWALGFMTAGRAFMEGQWPTLISAAALILVLMVVSKIYGSKSKR